MTRSQSRLDSLLAALAQARFTGIGSLPYADAAEAVHAVAEHAPRFPFWPQLPKRTPDEGMIEQTKEALERGDFDEDHAAGLFELERAWSAGVFARAVAVKGQLTGPVTLSRDPSFAGAIPSAAVARLAGRHAERLARLKVPVLVQLDEPGLTNVEPGAAAAALAPSFGAIRAAGATVGLHCCGKFPFAVLAAAPPDVLFIDARLNGNELAASAEARAFVADGGAIAFGIAPSRRPIDAVDASDLLAPLRAAFPRGVAATDVLCRALVTATCGLANLAPADVAGHLRCVEDLARRVHALAGAAPEKR